MEEKRTAAGSLAHIISKFRQGGFDPTSPSSPLTHQWQIQQPRGDQIWWERWRDRFRKKICDSKHSRGMSLHALSLLPFGCLTLFSQKKTLLDVALHVSAHVTLRSIATWTLNDTAGRSRGWLRSEAVPIVVRRTDPCAKLLMVAAPNPIHYTGQRNGVPHEKPFCTVIHYACGAWHAASPQSPLTLTTLSQPLTVNPVLASSIKTTS